MKLILKFIFLCALAVLLAMLSNYGPGHVIIFIKNYRLDLSLTTLIIGSLIFYCLIYYLYVFLSDIYHIPASFRRYRQKRAIIKNRTYFNIAATNYFQGNYITAYNNALKSMSKDVTAYDKFPVFLLTIETINLLDVEEESKTLARIDKLLSKLSNKSDFDYIYNELSQINKTKNNKFYSKVLDRMNENK